MRNCCGPRTERARSARLQFLGIGLLFLISPSSLHAQGVASAAIHGIITSRGGAPIVDAIIVVRNLSNGAHRQATSRGGGRYVVDNLTVGGPYVVTVRAIGHRPWEISGVMLSLGERHAMDLVLEPSAVELESMTVRAETDPRLNAGRTGPAQAISESTLARLPVPSRDFSLMALLSPQVTRSRSGGGLSIAGQPNRLNALQIDGATANDLEGSSALGGVGTPGQGLGARALPVEAVKELQVLSAPFDVRFGSFAGGIVNAVTRSGSNRWEGSVTGFYSGETLIGPKPDDTKTGEFEQGEIGFTLGGPLVRDRAAFFMAGGVQRYTLLEQHLVIGNDTTGGADSAGTGIRLTSLRRFQSILRNGYGVDPGGADPFRLTVPARNLFAKVTLQLGVNSQFEASHAYAHSMPDVLQFGCRDPGTPYCLDSRVFRLPFTLHATRLEWSTASAGGLTNRLLLGWLWSLQRCLNASDYAAIEVGADNGILSAGQAVGCRGERTIQNFLELTDDLTFSLGSHRLTVGTHDEWVRIPSLRGLEYFFFTNWTFENLDSLELGRPTSYTAIVRGPERPTGPLSDLDVKQLGMYVQDQWAATRRLTLTAGIRLEVPFLTTAPRHNPALLAQLGLDNSRTPSGHALWSPRLGVNYDLQGNGRTYLRGGVGLFAGRPAFKWFEDVFSHTGLEAVDLFCYGTEVPAFTLDPERQPTACAGGSAKAPAAVVNVFDPAFRFPRNLKMALGADHQLPWGIVATADLLYTRSINQYDLMDLNLLPPTTAAGEGNRLMYGVIDSLGVVRPTRRSDLFGPVLLVRNRKGNHAVNLTAQLQKDFGGGVAFNVSYSVARSRDWFSAFDDNPNDDLEASPLDGSLARRRLATSLWDVPHRLTLMIAADLPWAFKAALFYEGVSGGAYTYLVAGDANGDGFGNDIVYVPRDVRPGGDISLVVFDEPSQTFIPAPASVYQRLDRAIEGTPCLRQARGHIMGRNTCRNPWVNSTSARIARTFDLGGHRLELTLDAFNLLHLLKNDWGQVWAHDDRLLQLVGYDSGRSRGVYEVMDTFAYLDEAATRWRLQLGARYEF
jgi:hypothetical protein